MTWTIWINVLPLSHIGSTLNVASVGPVVSEKIFENTHTHTNTFFAHQNTTAESCSRWKILGGGGFEGKALYFFVGEGGGGEAVLLFFLFLFYFVNPVGSWFLWKCLIFCRWWSVSKMQFIQMGSLGMKKKFLFLEEGSPEKKKKEMCECHGGDVDW